MPREQTEYVKESAYRRIRGAWVTLRNTPFCSANHVHGMDGPWQRLAADWFNSATLWKVFGLCPNCL
jgi:hypothetical protein